MSESKPSNPKDAFAVNKVPMHLWPTAATALGAMALLDGALKYGRSNFRAVGVKASVYNDACQRHLGRWMDGEDLDKDSGLPNLAHALACLAIVIDAHYAGKLIDDRNFAGGGFEKALGEMAALIPGIREKYADKSPHHYTIQDEVEPSDN